MNRAHDRVDAAGMLEPLLAAAAAVGASDLHLSGGAPPLLRVDGTLRAIPEAWLDPAEIERICFAMLGADHGETLQRLGAADFACETSVGRVRVNIYRRRDSVAACLRLIAQEIPPLSSLGLPGAAERLVDLRHGLVLVTGATGNGKSTTLAAMVRALLERRAIHVLTIEDPIEVVHRPALGLVNQRELGADTPSFAQALRHALRQDPDVVLVGELRDAETVRAALTLAETGHLVLSTLHSPTATQAVRRIVDIFPVSEHAAVRAQLAEVLQGILSQALLPRIGGGRVLACELLVANNAVRALIREDRAHQLPSQIESGQARSGMQSMSQALAALLRAGSIAEEIAAEQAAALGPCRPDGTKS